MGLGPGGAGSTGGQANDGGAGPGGMGDGSGGQGAESSDNLSDQASSKASQAYADEYAKNIDKWKENNPEAGVNVKNILGDVVEKAVKGGLLGGPAGLIGGATVGAVGGLVSGTRAEMEAASAAAKAAAAQTEKNLKADGWSDADIADAKAGKTTSVEDPSSSTPTGVESEMGSDEDHGAEDRTFDPFDPWGHSAAADPADLPDTRRPGSNSYWFGSGDDGNSADFGWRPDGNGSFTYINGSGRSFTPAPPPPTPKTFKEIYQEDLASAADKYREGHSAIYQDFLDFETELDAGYRGISGRYEDDITNLPKMSLRLPGAMGGGAMALVPKARQAQIDRQMDQRMKMAGEFGNFKRGAMGDRRGMVQDLYNVDRGLPSDIYASEMDAENLALAKKNKPSVQRTSGGGTRSRLPTSSPDDPSDWEKWAPLVAQYGPGLVDAIMNIGGGDSDSSLDSWTMPEDIYDFDTNDYSFDLGDDWDYNPGTYWGGDDDYLFGSDPWSFG